MGNCAPAFRVGPTAQHCTSLAIHISGHGVNVAVCVAHNNLCDLVLMDPDTHMRVSVWLGTQALECLDSMM